MRRGVLAIPLTWQISIKGAEEVKQKLQDLNGQFARGEISLQEYSKQSKQAASSARVLTSQHQLQNRVLQAQYPIINSVTRATSVLGSISRGVLAITTALNVARLFGNQMSQERADILLQLVDLENKLAQTNDPDLIRQYSDQIKILKERLAEIEKEEETQKFNDIATAIASVGSMAAITASSIKNLLPNLVGMINFFRSGGGFSPNKLLGAGLIGLGAAGLATGGIDAILGKSKKLEDRLKAIGSVAGIGVGISLMVPAIAEIALIGTAIATATIAILVFREELAGFFTWLGGQLGINGESLTKFFVFDLPLAFAQGIMLLIPMMNSLKSILSTGWNGIISVINLVGSAITDGINAAAAAIANAINFFIDVYNRVAKKLGKATIETLTFTPITFTPVPLVAAQHGFSGVVNKPTMFLAGEAGAESVNISPRGRGNGSQITILFNNYGSIASEREVFGKFDQYLKSELRRRGFTGY